jgi:hypothetical protein
MSSTKLFDWSVLLTTSMRQKMRISVFNSVVPMAALATD